MALETFVPPVPPHVGSGVSVGIRTRDLQFGEGYGMHLEDGPNAISKPVTLVWSIIAPTDADTIEDWMKARKGMAFLYQPPRESTPRQFRCTDIQRRFARPTKDTLTLSLVEDFNLG